MKKIAIIDVSHAFWTAWHAASGDNQNAAWKVVARIRSLRSEYDHVIAACDDGPSFRKEEFPDYKGGRAEKPGGAIQQLSGLKKELVDVCRVASAPGFEADDIIATICAFARLEEQIEEVHIVSDDKDLYQCVGGNISLLHRSGELRDARWVFENLGCPPAKVPQWLALIGDTADNLPGIPGIGPKTAKKLFADHGDITGMIKAAFENQLTPAISAALIEHESSAVKVEKLATLVDNVKLDFERIMAPMPQTEPEAEPKQDAKTEEPAKPQQKQDTAKALVPTVIRTPASWSMELEPSNGSEAASLCARIHESGLFPEHQSWASVLVVMLAGRELGIPSIASLRGFHIIRTSNKTVICPSAHLMVGICLRSPRCAAFNCIEFLEDRVTWEAQRKDQPPLRNTWTIERAAKAGLYKPVPKGDRDAWKWESSTWCKYTQNMLSARASSELARLVFPDIVMNTYAAEEMAGQRDVDAIEAMMREQIGGPDDE